ncbi:membrane protein [Caenimonas sp. SL110]|uniref:membrane protein n=1 Tax=Caenimonas sp. SL110 TaxID=1450524 RepID=UPI000652EA65|nr:membrane protein [Caenimonas sp. SL110]
MTQPTPAIVAQEAAGRLPRLALLLFCVAYVVPGFIGREPWKSQDITGFGYMFELARGSASWLAPSLLGQPPEFDGLLPYWLGALAIQVTPSGLAPDLGVRLVFALLLALTLVATWYAVYNLSRTPLAQPVPFAFGGEASTTDYSRAIADAGLLALIACLGLAQLSHETTPALAQVAFTAVAFFAMAALPRKPIEGGLGLGLGLTCLALSGAPVLALLFGAGGLAVSLLPDEEDGLVRRRVVVMVYSIALTLTLALTASLDLWHWRINDTALARDWTTQGRLFIWFTWPAWPFALWTLWRWRRQLLARHLALPLWITLVCVVTAFLTPASDRSLLLALPPLATLAAFALPTLSRSVAALIDWFTLLFFSGCAFIIWVVWISMQTGVPPKPAANVAKLAPGFEPSFSFIAFACALAATVAWALLVKWRTGRHRVVIWKSLVLPAGGAALCWVLLMTLWLPVLDYARGYTPVVRGITRHIDKPGCVEVFGLTRSEIAAFRYHGDLELRPAGRKGVCPWMLVDDELQWTLPFAIDMSGWKLVVRVRRPTDAKDNVVLYRNLAFP